MALGGAFPQYYHRRGLNQKTWRRVDPKSDTLDTLDDVRIWLLRKRR